MHELAIFEFDRSLAAFDGADIVGTAGAYTFQMGVPGEIASVAGVTAVSVLPSHRRRGIGRALLCRMLRDDRARSSRCSVLTASHTGALLYPRVGYERIGTLLMFAPRRAKP